MGKHSVCTQDECKGKLTPLRMLLCGCIVCLECGYTYEWHDGEYPFDSDPTVVNKED